MRAEASGGPPDRKPLLCGGMKARKAVSQASQPAPGSCIDERVTAARHALLEGVGAEIAASFPGITRLGGQLVAALYLAEGPCSMDELAVELDRSKSNIFANLRGLEAAGILDRRRGKGARHDSYTLRGKYPDVIIGAYIGRLRRVVHDKQALCRRSLGLLGDAQGVEADALRARLDDLSRKYDLFAELMDNYVPPIDGPVDLEQLITRIPEPALKAIQLAAHVAWAAGRPPRSRS